jgi:hypothetical protein
MKALLQQVVESFQEDFGHPVKLIRLLQEHPDICVSLETIGKHSMTLVVVVTV